MKFWKNTKIKYYVHNIGRCEQCNDNTIDGLQLYCNKKTVCDNLYEKKI
jgi:formylmethanofuran dehydrogenase subunit E